MLELRHGHCQGADKQPEKHKVEAQTKAAVPFQNISGVPLYGPHHRDPIYWDPQFLKRFVDEH